MVLGQIGAFKRREPKTAKSRRVLKKQAPQAFENPKKVLMLRGMHTSEVVTDAMNDISAILQPHCKKLKKRNAFNPFEGVEHLQFLGFKNDCSMFCFGSDNKKRRNNLVIGRQHDFQLLDMVELGLLAMDRLEIGKSKGSNGASLGSKPLFVFEGSEFDSDPFFIRLKNLLLDFFRGTAIREVNLTGVDRAIFISLRSSDGAAVVAPSDDCRGTKPPTNKGNAIICFRHYAVTKEGASSIVTNVSERTVDKLQLVDIGPNFDAEIRRTYFSPAQEFKRACRLSKEELAEQQGGHENVSTDNLGNLRGQIHVGKQDVSQLNLRRFKAQRVNRKTERVDGAAPAATHDDEDAPTRKKKRRSATDEPNFHTQIPEADI